MMRNIVVEPYSAEWPRRYAEEAALLRRTLGPVARAIHHVGSTSVPGLAAKPVIDIMIIVDSHDELARFDQAMRDIGYDPKGEFGIPGRRFYAKGPDDHRTHNVHAYEPGHEEIAKHLAFRDFLKTHPDEARRYAALKRELAARFRNDITSYVEGKSGLVTELIERALPDGG